MYPEAPKQEIDGRHPFDQGVSATHWNGVIAEINSRTPRLPELDIQIAESETIPSEGVLFDAAVDAPIAEEAKQDGRLARARKAWAMLEETIKLPELKPLVAPALAITVAACNANGPTPTPSHPEQSPSAPIVSQAPTSSPEASQTPVASPSASAEATPTTEPTVEPTPTRKPISTITEAKSTAVEFLTMARNFEDAAKIIDLTTVDDFWTNTQIAKAIKECKNGNKKSDLPLETTKFQACKRIAFIMLEAYEKTGEDKFYEAAKEAYDYTYIHFPDQRDFLKDYFNSNFS